MLIFELAVLFLLPALIIFLTKKFSALKMIGAVTFCYCMGFLFSVLPIPYDKGLSETVASVLVALAIPLILFGFDITSVRFLAKKTLIAFGLLIISVVAVSTVSALIASPNGLDEASTLAGMATGLYIGGTPNMFAIGNALLKDTNLINLVNIADSTVGGIYILLVFAVIHKVYRRFLGGKKETPESANGKGEVAVTGEYDYKVIPHDKKSIFRLVGVILIAVACLGIGVLVEILVNGNMNGSLFIMISVSLLGIAISFVKPVRETKGTYQIGQYLILVFSLGLGMSIDFGKIAEDMIPVFLFFTGVQLAAIIVHFLLCKVFKIDGGTALITCIAGIFGPPFIAPTAGAYGDRDLLLPGVICGTLGLMIGNIIGIGLGMLLPLLV